MRRAGLHRRTQQGIDWTSEGALAVVFSGGYADDEWSEDDPWYTGQGGQDEPRGRQVRDQELVDGNLALERSYRAGLPVRVIRRVPVGHDYEYVYEGLYPASRRPWSARPDASAPSPAPPPVSTQDEPGSTRADPWSRSMPPPSQPMDRIVTGRELPATRTTA